MIRRTLFGVLAAGLLLAAGSAEAASFVQSKSAVGGGATTIAITFTSNVSAGDLIACAVVMQKNPTVGTISSVSDGTTNYTVIDSYLAGACTGATSQCRLATYYLKNAPSGSTTITATFSAAPDNAWLVCHEASGVDTAAPLDQHTTNEQFAVGTGTDAITVGPVTTTTNGQYIFAVAFDELFGGDHYAAGTGYSGREHQVDLYSEDKIQTLAGAISATFTSTVTTDSVTAIATFKAAGGGCIIGGGIMRAGCPG